MIERKKKLWKMTTSGQKLCWFVGFLDFYCFLVRCQVISLLEEDETITKDNLKLFAKHT